MLTASKILLPVRECQFVASRDIWSIIGGKISETLSSITLDMMVKMNQEKAGNAVMHNI